MQVGNFIKKETLVQVFSCEFYEIFTKTLSTEHLQTAASATVKYVHKELNFFLFKFLRR